MVTQAVRPLRPRRRLPDRLELRDNSTPAGRRNIRRPRRRRLMLTEAQIADFHRDGYLFVKNLLDPEETRMLLETAKADHLMMGHAVPIKDAGGRQSKLSLWNRPGDDIYGTI